MAAGNGVVFRRVFVANRGEIAVRIVRACAKLGIESVVAVSEADRDSLAARLATRAVCIGPARSTSSYLRPEILISAAKGTGCDALHPGYGFLAESAAFSRMCGEAGVVFIGPSPTAIEAMGDKITAVQLAAQAGLPCVPGTQRLESAAEARRAAREIGYPVLLKASAGGGGRGMRIVRTEAETESAMNAATAEAHAAFGDPALYMEKFVERARHIEIQVLGDRHGHVVHLGDRECSTQRRHQKLIEEAPSPVIDRKLRADLCEAAVSLARRVNYEGAGTVEFVFDDDNRRFYFIEMNTRIQVEHPVTEMVTGRDLVSEQIRIAADLPISFEQDDVCVEGHAIECRINAEDPARNFMPSPGRLLAWAPPQGAGLRVDTHCYAGYVVPPFYDSLLAKVIMHAPNRADAIAGMLQALDRFAVDGVKTTIDFHKRVLAHEDFRRARVTSRWVEEEFLGRA